MNGRYLIWVLFQCETRKVVEIRIAKSVSIHELTDRATKVCSQVRAVNYAS